MPSSLPSSALAPTRSSRARAALGVLLALCIGPVLLAATAPAAGARQVEGWDVPSNARITVTGNGYGHGHGMSQWGAQGAAKRGLSHREIVEFYYPGTEWGQARGRIRVLVTADTTDDLVVLARPGLTATRLDRPRTWQLPARRAGHAVTRWRMRGLAGGRTGLDYRTGRSWTRFRTFAGEGHFAGRRTVTLVLPAGRRAYRGKLRSAAPRPGARERDTVNIVGLEAYLKGVVPLEMPALWEPAAVRAQAVAARTYAAFERTNPRGRHFDVYDTTQSQVYGGRDAEHPAANQAVRATRREALQYAGRPAFTQFSASNGGWGSAGSVPYLVAQRDPYDAEASPYVGWTVEIADEVLERAFPALGNLQRIEVLERDGNGDWGGRVERIRLVGGRGSVTTTGDDVRFRLGLRSEWFTFDVATARRR